MSPTRRETLAQLAALVALPLADWAGDQLTRLTGFSPKEIDEALVCCILGARGAPPEVAAVVRLVDERSQADLVQKYPGEAINRGTVTLSMGPEFGYYIADGRTVAIAVEDELRAVADPVLTRLLLENLLNNQFKIGADASVAAGPVGRDASASTDIQLRAQILSYSRTRGLFAGVTLNGSTIRQDRDANERFYGVAYRTKSIVLDKIGGAPDPSGEWKAALAKHAGGLP